MLLSILSASLALAATANAQCSRAMLQDATAQYLEAQSMGMVDMLASISPNVTYHENDQPVNIRTGVISHPIKMDYNRSIYDTTACGTFTEIIAPSNPHPYVIGTRMLFTGSKITTIESIVTDQGDWAFNATGYLYWNSIENWTPMRQSRAAVQAAGDAYFNRFLSENVTVPWDTPCARLEGGAYTGAGNLTAETCTIGGMPVGINVTNRRYIVDEEQGVVDIFVGFPGLDRSMGNQPMPDSHMFKVEGGKIRYVHTVSACVHAGCGMNGTGPPGRLRKRVGARNSPTRISF